MSWKLGQAKQHLSEVVRLAQRTPQRIQNRDLVVAAVIDAKTFDEFIAWRDKRRDTLADALGELRAIVGESAYRLDIPPREDRIDPFSSTLSAAAAKAHPRKSKKKPKATR